MGPVLARPRAIGFPRRQTCSLARNRAALWLALGLAGSVLAAVATVTLLWPREPAPVRR